MKSALYRCLRCGREGFVGPKSHNCRGKVVPVSKCTFEKIAAEEPINKPLGRWAELHAVAGGTL